MAFLTLFRVSTGDNWNGIMKVLFLNFPQTWNYLKLHERRHCLWSKIWACFSEKNVDAPHTTGQLTVQTSRHKERKIYDICSFWVVEFGLLRNRIYCFNKREKICMLRAGRMYLIFSYSEQHLLLLDKQRIAAYRPYYFWISLYMLYFNNCWIISVPFSSFPRTHCGSVVLWIATASPTFPSSLLSTLSPSCSLLSSYLSMWSWPSSWSTWRTATRRLSWRRWRRKQRWERRRKPANASLQHLWAETWCRTWKHLRR